MKKNLTESEKRKLLHNRLNNNYADYNDHLMKLAKDEIIKNARKISDTQIAYMYMTYSNRFNECELDFLLKFANPLEVVTDYMHIKHDCEFDLASDDDLESIITDICDKRDMLGDYALMQDDTEL